MHYDDEISNTFYNVCRDLESNYDENKIREAINLITDEKMIYGRLDQALKKIDFLERLYKNIGKNFPELIYRKAVIIFEYGKNNEKAEKILLNLKNETLDSKILDRIYFYLARINFKKYMYKKDSTLILEGRKYIEILDNKAKNEEINQTVLTWLSMLKDDYNDIDLEPEFNLINFPGLKIFSFWSEEEYKSQLENPDIFIDFNLKKILIKNIEKKISKSDLELIILLLRRNGCNLNDCCEFLKSKRKLSNQDELKELSEAAFSKRLERLRKTIDIEDCIPRVLDKTAKLSNKIKVQILSDNDNLPYLQSDLLNLYE